jgi:hypothetical protein
MGNTAEFNAWRNSRGGATATDECGTISWSDSMGESGLCGETYQIGMTFTATSSDECFEDEVDTFAIFRVEDTQGAEVLCGSPATMSPNDAPIGFTSGASDTCCGDDTSAVIDSFRCYMINGAGREIDKGQSCEVSIEGDTIQIDDTGGTGGQGTFIEWTVSAVDCCGNASQQICAVEVVDPN